MNGKRQASAGDRKKRGVDRSENAVDEGSEHLPKIVHPAT
jgi:hypothetical protein